MNVHISWLSGPRFLASLKLNCTQVNFRPTCKGVGQAHLIHSYITCCLWATSDHEVTHKSTLDWCPEKFLWCCKNKNHSTWKRLWLRQHICTGPCSTFKNSCTPLNHIFMIQVKIIWSAPVPHPPQRLNTTQDRQNCFTSKRFYSSLYFFDLKYSSMTSLACDSLP